MPIGLSELFLILLLVLLLFGAKNIPEIARNLGKSMGAFKKGIRDSEKDLIDDKELVDDKDNKKE